ncbi:hypothetical protein Bpfe_027786 [Biomphalaria pfeifferi]|uniref:Uncharacterized protein n=1 Tax=Biomphalaria pfeifferi TaxID=112525 RepID=A0AAD8EWB2_BIOPF|nr:hypothetical protein Bpfe_027786 [Biomphalaria pfeifferi]
MIQSGALQGGEQRRLLKAKWLVGVGRDVFNILFSNHTPPPPFPFPPGDSLYSSFISGLSTRAIVQHTIPETVKPMIVPPTLMIKPPMETSPREAVCLSGRVPITFRGITLITGPTRTPPCMHTQDVGEQDVREQDVREQDVREQDVREQDVREQDVREQEENSSLARKSFVLIVQEETLVFVEWTE